VSARDLGKAGPLLGRNLRETGTHELEQGAGNPVLTEGANGGAGRLEAIDNRAAPVQNLDLPEPEVAGGRAVPLERLELLVPPRVPDETSRVEVLDLLGPVCPPREVDENEPAAGTEEAEGLGEKLLSAGGTELKGGLETVNFVDGVRPEAKPLGQGAEIRGVPRLEADTRMRAEALAGELDVSLDEIDPVRVCAARRDLPMEFLASRRRNGSSPNRSNGSSSTRK
jgi:hypothetical protein